jgi:hypothetical protein
MARKRFVTSEISTDRKIAKLAEKNPTAAALWPWFITAFDDWGRMNADPIEVKLAIFPAFPYTSDEIEEFIKLYHEFEIAYFYEVDEKPYLAVNPDTWLKYQTYIRKDKLEKQNSKIPGPKDAPWLAKNDTNNDLATINVAKQQSATINVPSPSPSPSPSSDKRSSSQPDGATTPEATKPDNKRERKTKVKFFTEDSVEYRLAFLLRSEILKNLPDARVPQNTPEGLSNWCIEIGRMIRLDKRKPEEIAFLIRWAQSDSFWRANILSPKKLRDKWETVKLQAQRKGELNDGGTSKQHNQHPGKNQSEFSKIDFSQFEFKGKRAGVPEVSRSRGDPTGERGCSDMPLSGAKEA